MQPRGERVRKECEMRRRGRGRGRRGRVRGRRVQVVVVCVSGSENGFVWYFGFYSRICGWDWGSSGKFAGESVGVNVNPSASDGTSPPPKTKTRAFLEGKTGSIRRPP